MSILGVTKYNILILFSLFLYVGCSCMCIHTVWECMPAYSETREGCWASSCVAVTLFTWHRIWNLLFTALPGFSYLFFLEQGWQPCATMPVYAQVWEICMQVCIGRTQQSLLPTEPSSIHNILDIKVLRTVWSKACNLYLNDWSQNICKNSYVILDINLYVIFQNKGWILIKCQEKFT